MDIEDREEAVGWALDRTGREERMLRRVLLSFGVFFGGVAFGYLWHYMAVG